eukprot:symbB.v1.2.000041.t1/scaffold12.1/size699752/21
MNGAISGRGRAGLSRDVACSGAAGPALPPLPEVLRSKKTCPPETFTRRIRACAQKGAWAEALKILAELQQEDQADLFHYNAAISACSSARQAWEMSQQRLDPDVYTYGALLRSADANAAKELLEEMKQRGVKRNVVVSSLAMKALAKTADAKLFTSALGACSAGSCWAQAFSLLDEMREVKVAPDRMTWNAVMTVCARAGQWQQALSLFDRMDTRPDIFTFNSALQALRFHSSWQMALNLFRRLPEHVLQPDMVSFNTLMAITAEQQPNLAIELLGEMYDASVPRSERSYFVLMASTSQHWERKMMLISHLPWSFLLAKAVALSVQERIEGSLMGSLIGDAMSLEGTLQAGRQTWHGENILLALEYLASRSFWDRDASHPIDLNAFIPYWKARSMSLMSAAPPGRPDRVSRSLFAKANQSVLFNLASGVHSKDFSLRFGAALGVFSTEEELLKAHHALMFMYSSNSLEVLDTSEFFCRSLWRIIHQGLSPSDAFHIVAKNMSRFRSSKWLRQKLEDTRERLSVEVDSDANRSLQFLLGETWAKSQRSWDLFPSSIYLILKYEDNLTASLMANAQLPGERAARAVAIGLVLGAYHGLQAVQALRNSCHAFDKALKLLRRLPLFRPSFLLPTNNETPLTDAMSRLCSCERRSCKGYRV